MRLDLTGVKPAPIDARPWNDQGNFVRDKVSKHPHELIRTATKPAQTRNEHNLDFSGPHGSDEFLQVGDNRDIFFPTSPHTILPERVVSWDPRINYDHVFTCLPGAFQARLKARVGLFLDFESKGMRRSITLRA